MQGYSSISGVIAVPTSRQGHCGLCSLDSWFLPPMRCITVLWVK